MEMPICQMDKGLLKLDSLLYGLVKGIEHLVEHPVFDGIAEFPVAEDSLEDLAILVHSIYEFGLECLIETVFEVVSYN